MDFVAAAPLPSPKYPANKKIAPVAPEKKMSPQSAIALSRRIIVTATLLRDWFLQTAAALTRSPPTEPGKSVLKKNPMNPMRIVFQKPIPISCASIIRCQRMMVPQTPKKKRKIEAKRKTKWMGLPSTKCFCQTASNPFSFPGSQFE